MKSSWIRLAFAAGVLAAVVAGGSALATPDLIKKDTIVSVQCCCCTEGANHRSFIGG